MLQAELRHICVESHLYRKHCTITLNLAVKAIEKVYDVHVVRVNMITMRGKVKNFGRRSSKTSDWKKAIITLKEGESIQGAQS